MCASPRVEAGVLQLHACCFCMTCTALLHSCIHSMFSCYYTGKNTCAILQVARHPYPSHLDKDSVTATPIPRRLPKITPDQSSG